MVRRLLATAAVAVLAVATLSSGVAEDTALQPVTHIQGWSVASGGNATIKVRQEEDGRYRFFVADGQGRVLARGPADGFATQSAAEDHAQRLVGGYWHPHIAP